MEEEQYAPDFLLGPMRASIHLLLKKSDAILWKDGSKFLKLSSTIAFASFQSNFCVCEAVGA
ncbi:MAG: hypothetical protein BWY32_03667 [bacterium ADurb.Bin243]|nr:MAG: hypothetical protein BWY32_03667 [bacterium ADurb.Bin243]